MDLTAWLPLDIAGYEPYEKLDYIVSGEYSSSVAGTSSNFNASGTKFAVGIKYAPIPLVAFMLKIEKSNVKLEADYAPDSTADELEVLLGDAVGI